MRGTPTLKRTASSLSLNQRLPVGQLVGAASTANTPLRRKISTVGLDDQALRASPIKFSNGRPSFGSQQDLSQAASRVLETSFCVSVFGSPGPRPSAQPSPSKLGPAPAGGVAGGDFFCVDQPDSNVPRPPGSYPHVAESPQSRAKPQSNHPKTSDHPSKARSNKDRLRRAASKALKHRGPSIRKQLLKHTLADKRALLEENTQLLNELEEVTAAHDTLERAVGEYGAQVHEMETAMRDLVSQHIVQLQSRESALRRAQEEVAEAAKREEAHEARKKRIEELRLELDTLRRANQAMLRSRTQNASLARTGLQPLCMFQAQRSEDAAKKIKR